MSLLSQIIRGYLILVNLITRGVFGRDKRMAVKQRRRISEKALLLRMLAGWALWGLVAMEQFRHKRIKGSFLWRARLMVLVWVVIAVLAGMYL